MKILFLFLLQTGTANADCEFLVEALRAQTAKLRILKQAHDGQQLLLASAQARCESGGASLAAAAARAAEGTACEGLRENERLEAESASLGAECETRYSRLEREEKKLVDLAAPLVDDIRQGVELFRNSPALLELCGEDARVTRSLHVSFEGLQEEMLQLREHARKGSDSYRKMRTASAALASASRAARDRCAVADESVPSLDTHVHAQGSGVPAGKSPERSSTITGTERVPAGPLR